MFNKLFGREVRNRHYEVTDEGVFLPKSKVWVGGVFYGEHRRGGDVLHVDKSNNLITLQGRNHILDVILGAQAKAPSWYLGLYKNPYTPQATDTAASFPTDAAELTEYVETDRQEFVDAPASGAVITNTASRAVFTINATVTLNGTFLASIPTKLSTAGVLLSATRRASPRDLENLDEYLVRYDLEATSA